MANLCAEKHLYCGPEKSGKSYLAKRRARMSRRLAILDLNQQADLAVGAIVVTTERDFLNAWQQDIDGRKKHHVCWQVPNTLSARRALKWALHVSYAVGGFDFLIDEAETFLPNDVKLKSDEIEYIAAKRGRHKFGCFHLTAQKPNDLHRHFRDNCVNTYYFKGGKAAYLSQVEKNLNSPVDNRKPAKALMLLEEYEYIQEKRDGTWRKMKKI